MKRGLSRVVASIGVGGLVTIGMTSAAYAATGSAVREATAGSAPAWHTVLSVANGGTSNQVNTVIATGRTTGWAFLAAGTVAYQRAGVTGWKKVTFPGTGGWVRAAGASSPSNVWAVYQLGNGSGTEMYHWNGRKWKAAKWLPQVSGTAISVLGRNNVWVFGNGAFHFNGRTWTEVSATAPGGSALSDHNVWSFNGTEVEHYNGRTWTATNVASLLPPKVHAPSSVTNILALAPNDVYATGEGEQTPRGGPGVLLHYNGRSWTRVAESGGFASTTGEAMASDGKGGLWIAAQDFPARYPQLFHYSAGQLTAVNLGATSISVSRIPGTREALSGGFQAGNGNGSSVVQQYS